MLTEGCGLALRGGGEIGALMHSIDWSKTPVGKLESWPPSLCTAVNIVLNSKFPMFIWWGKDALTNIYNDACINILGEKHPDALGKSARNTWAEIWDGIGPMAEQVFTKGEPVYMENLLLIINRYGYPEETYFTFSFSPIHGETGDFEGLYCACVETTQHVVAKRRVILIRAIAAVKNNAKTIDAVCHATMNVLKKDAPDIPFASIYMHNQSSKQLELLASVNLGEPAAKIKTIEQKNLNKKTWPAWNVMKSGEAQEVKNLRTRFGKLSNAYGPGTLDNAYILPLTIPSQKEPIGVLIVGINPRKKLDNDYRNFLELAKGHIATAINNAVVYEQEKLQLKEVEDTKAKAIAAKKRLYDLFMNAPGFVAVISGPELVFEIANPPYRQLLGKDRLLDGKPLLEAVPDIEPSLLKIVKNVAEKGERFVADELPITLAWDNNKKPYTKYINLSYEPLYDEHNKPSGLMCFGYEVTEQVIARQKIAEREAEYRTLFNSIDQGFCIVEMLFDAKNKPIDYRFLETNRVFENQTGLKHAAGKTARELVPDLEQKWFDIYGKVALTGKPERFEDGSKKMGRWFDVHASRIGGSASQKVAILFTDITDRKRTQEKLIESEAYYRQMTDNTPVITWITDSEARCTYLNKKWYDYTGQKAEEALGFGWLSQIHPDDAKKAGDIFLEANKKRIPFSLEYRLKNKDEMYRWAIDAGLPKFNETGSFEGYIGSVVDIHERKLAEEVIKENEERLRFMAESMPQKIFTAGPDGKIDYLTPQWTEFTGLSFAEVTDKNWGLSQFIHPDEIDEHHSKWLYSIKNGEPFQSEHRLRRKDGQYRWHLTRTQPLRTKKNKIVMWTGSSTDIEDIKRTVEQKNRLEKITASLRKQREQLLSLNKAQDEFISIASHQLRTPASAVKQYLGMIIQGFAQEPDQQKEIIEIAYSSNERQIEMINDLLKVAHIDGGNVELNHETVDLTALIQDILDDQASIFMNRAQDYNFKHGKNNVEASVDKNKIRMMLENITDNASKYTPNGKNIHIALKKVGKKIVITIRDEGVGIKPQDINKLFKKFSRLENSLSIEVGGTGLGLYWAKRVIDLHDGTITISSKPNEGSMFTITLPADTK